MSDKKTVMYFTATWCGPCKAFGPIVNSVVAELGTAVELKKIDIDEDSETAINYSIRGVPSIVVLDSSGKEVSRNVGLTTKDKLQKQILGS